MKTNPATEITITNSQMSVPVTFTTSRSIEEIMPIVELTRYIFDMNEDDIYFSYSSLVKLVAEALKCSEEHAEAFVDDLNYGGEFK